MARNVAEKTPYPFDDSSAFVLAAGGFRRLRDGGTFLGHGPGRMFWMDALDLVHEDDLALAGKLVSGTVGRPNAVRNAALRMRDARGGWRLVKATARNVAEAPGDAGLVIADFHEVPQANGQAG